MGFNLSVMLLMRVGVAQDVKDCGKIRILGLYLQDSTGKFRGVLGPGNPFEKEVSDFMDKTESVYPGSMFGVYGFTDRLYSPDPKTPTVQGSGDFRLITPLVNVSTAQSKISELGHRDVSGLNSDAFDVMYHLIVNDADSGIDSIPSMADAYDAKVLYVFTDGIPQYLESTMAACTVPVYDGYSCFAWCDPMSAKCCIDDSSGGFTLQTSKVDYGSAWNPLAACPMDLATLGKKINDNDWYVAYITVGDWPDQAYNWSVQVALMGIESRIASYPIFYNYSGLSDALVNVTSKIMCSAVPSNNPANLPTGGATVAPSTGGSTSAPTTGTPTTETPTTGGATYSGQGGTTTTTTKKPFPIGLVCGCAAGALAAIAGGMIAANRLTGYPPMPEFEFEGGDEGMEREESQRETQVAMGEADFA